MTNFQKNEYLVLLLHKDHWTERPSHLKQKLNINTQQTSRGTKREHYLLFI